VGQNILPFYLVCDESASMSGDAIDAMNTALPELHAEIGMNPVVSDKTQFAIIGFSDDAEVLLELSDLSQISQLPELRAKGRTNYAAAMRCLKSQIETDLDRLKSQGHQVFRPVVFFLTDGQPTSDWEYEYNELTSPSFKYHPNIVSFGISQADPDVISAIATYRAFIQDDSSITPAAALQEFATALTKSIVKSGASVTKEGGLVLEAPYEVAGFTRLALDAV